MLIVFGLASQIKITYTAYKAALKLEALVENKFKTIFNEYLDQKKELEDSIVEANHAYKKKRIDSFRFHLENCDYEYKTLCEKLKSIESQISFTQDEISVFPKIFSVISLFGNIFLLYYQWISHIRSSDSTDIHLIKSITCSFILSIGFVGVYYAHNTRSIAKKLKLTRLEAACIKNSVKNKIKLLKTHEFYFK